MVEKIETIDISSVEIADSKRLDVIHQIMNSSRSIGFFCLKGTNIPLSLIEQMHSIMPKIFDCDDSVKAKQAITKENYRGYIPMSQFNANGTNQASDVYEGYKLHYEVSESDPITRTCDLYGPNHWPEHCPDVSDIILDYWQHLDDLTNTLLGLLEDGLGLEPGSMTELMVSPLTNMTLMHYPKRPLSENPSGIHAHKDTDIITIIAPDPVGGLEVQTPEGEWITPNCPEGGVIVNIGDMLEVWSGGRLVSTPHRVVNNSGHERYSFPYFAVPRHDVVIRPLVKAIEGFERPAVHCGHWSREIWRTNWPDERPKNDTPELGTIFD